MEYMNGYQDLKAWQIAMMLAKQTYLLTSRFPNTEQRRIVDQMRRAAVSIGSNIAEGSRKTSRAEKFHYYSIAYGSASELETQIQLAKSIPLAPAASFPEVEDTVDHVLRLLNLLTSRFRQPPPPTT
jgi:four helix bundle protein